MVKKLLVHDGGPVAESSRSITVWAVNAKSSAVTSLPSLHFTPCFNGTSVVQKVSPPTVSSCSAVGEVGGQGGYPVEPLGGVAVKRGRASSQDVLVPDGSVRSQIGPDVGGGQIRRNAQLVHILHVLAAGGAGSRWLGSRRRRRRGWLAGADGWVEEEAAGGWAGADVWPESGPGVAVTTTSTSRITSTSRTTSTSLVHPSIAIRSANSHKQRSIWLYAPSIPPLANRQIQYQNISERVAAATRSVYPILGNKVSL